MADALLHTLAGHYDSQGQLLNGGLLVELLERLSRASGGEVRQRRMGRVFVEAVDPNLYRDVVQAWLAEQPNLVLHVDTVVSRVELHGRRVRAVEVEGPAGQRVVEAGAFIDTSGQAVVFRALGPDYLLPAGPAVAGGFIFRLRGVEQKAVKFPRSVGLTRSVQEAVAAGELPRTCEGAWFDVGVFDDEVFVKLSVHDPEAIGEEDRFRQAAERLTAYLVRLDGFETARLTQVGRIGVREGGRARGEYCLTEADVRGGARFADAACRCAWPIEHWDAERGLSLEYLAEGLSYDIPLRALRAAEVENLWVAGKCLSAEPRAQASARCVGTCWAMGEAVGRAAHAFLSEGSNEGN